jgi:glycosyltransferase involved in cell wall biosynthesis
MRIAFVNWTNRVVGGAEQYVRRSAEFLLEMGHEVSLWHQMAVPADREFVTGAVEIPSWNAAELGMAESIRRLKNWRPDVVYCHGLLDADKEAEIIGIAPSVFFAHSYLGTCVGERRTTTFPVIQPCERKFGLSCLALFYPLRCGGLNPLTALSNYRSNVTRLRVLARYSAVITHSGFVAQLYGNQGINCRQVRFISDSPRPGECLSNTWAPGKEWRFLMLARMEEIKGGGTLLDSLPAVSSMVQRPIKLTMAGDGGSRARWETRAAQLMRNHPDISVEFPGWLSGDSVQAALRETDLLLMPSVWPEPYGLTGLEAAHWGAPCVAFRVGGIPDWLTEGVNGSLAKANPASAANYAEAIVRTISDESVYRRLRAGAMKKAQEMTMEAHYNDLMDVFKTAAETGRVQ